VLPVRRMDVGEATETVLSEAARAGYGSIATGRNSFRLTRIHRRPVFTRRTEAFDVSVVDRRGVVSVQVTGTIWIPLLGFIQSRLHHDGRRATLLVLPPERPAGGPDSSPRSTVGVLTAEPVGLGTDWTPPVMFEGASRDAAEPTVVRPRAVTDVPLGAGAAAVVRFGNGDVRRLTSVGLVIGRDPTTDPQLPAAEVVRIADLSLSRTHLSVKTDGGEVWIVDRHSTNGSCIVVGDRTSTCVPGAPTRVPPGGRVVFGGQEFVVDVG
jgi:pSer/pThr/pTyr-binding forkhead associated (FHA) protein